MKQEFWDDDYDGYCGTSYAAKLLKLSVGTILNLVESDILKAWRTQGGIGVSLCNQFVIINAPTI